MRHDGGGLTAHLPSGRGRRTTCLLLLAIFLCCELTIALAPALARTPGRPGTAITATRLRAEPERHGDSLLRLTRGAEITIYGKPDHGWYRARRGRLEGFVQSGDIATQPLARAQTKQKRHQDAKSRGDHKRRKSGSRSEPKKQRGGHDRNVSLEQRAAGHQRSRHQKRGNGQKPNHAQRATREVLVAADVNMRRGPSKSEPVQDVIPKRARVHLTGKHGNGFVEVRWRRKTGWALGKHLATAPAKAAQHDRNPSSWTQSELEAIIIEAADRYGQPREDMLRVANCESSFVPTAVNARGGSYGLFQFKPGTWLSTPFADYDIFDPRASANAAAWMWANGRRREWVCQ